MRPDPRPGAISGVDFVAPRVPPETLEVQEQEDGPWEPIEDVLGHLQEGIAVSVRRARRGSAGALPPVLLTEDVQSLRRLLSGDSLSPVALWLDLAAGALRAFGSGRGEVIFEIQPRHRRIIIDGATLYEIAVLRALRELHRRIPTMRPWQVTVDNTPPLTLHEVVFNPPTDLARGLPPLYHGTSDSAWRRIQFEGLRPRGEGGPVYGGVLNPSRPDRVYLTTWDSMGVALFAARAAVKAHGGERVVLRIAPEALDPKLLEPDEDSRMFTWQGSIRRTGTVAYRGVIPPTEITLAYEPDHEDAPPFEGSRARVLAAMPRDELDRLAAGGGPIRLGEAAPFRIRWKPMDEDWKRRFDQHTGDPFELPVGCRDLPPAVVQADRARKEQLLAGLLAWGGDRVSLSRWDDDLPLIVSHGQLWSGRGALRRPGEPGRCHGNVARFWERSPEKLLIATGYGLSADGMWRQHTFGVELAGGRPRIVETTVPRVAYFGAVLDAAQSRRFARENG
jgi:hypothetical protein